MSSHRSLINALKSDAIWTQPTKEPYLPDYVYGMCRKYNKTTPVGQRRKKIPVRVRHKLKMPLLWFIHGVVGYRIPSGVSLSRKSNLARLVYMCKLFTADSISN